jgi:hypothetical protein
MIEFRVCSSKVWQISSYYLFLFSGWHSLGGHEDANTARMNIQRMHDSTNHITKDKHIALLDE